MRFTHLARERFPVESASSSASAQMPAATDVTPEEVRKMILYLRRARDRAMDIRDRSPAGSYLESVLSRTIDGIALELSQLDYLLTCKPLDVSKLVPVKRHMRPAI